MLSHEMLTNIASHINIVSLEKIVDVAGHRCTAGAQSLSHGRGLRATVPNGARCDMQRCRRTRLKKVGTRLVPFDDVLFTRVVAYLFSCVMTYGFIYTRVCVQAIVEQAIPW